MCRFMYRNVIIKSKVFCVLGDPADGANMPKLTGPRMTYHQALFPP
jgi:hypothetical protein